MKTPTYEQSVQLDRDWIELKAKLDHGAAQRLIENFNKIHSIAGVRRQHYPDGEVFEMTLNGDAPENQPLEMVRRDGYTGDWKHSGPKVKGIETRRFKWVAVGYQPNLEAVRVVLASHGKIPEGQWREAVKQMFEPDGEYPRGVADPSWRGPSSDADFPCVGRGGVSDFGWAGSGRSGDWRWLVGVSK